MTSNEGITAAPGDYIELYPIPVEIAPQTMNANIYVDQLPALFDTSMRPELQEVRDVTEETA